MIQVEASSVIDASIDCVWPIVRDFGAIAEWLPGTRHAQVDGDGIADRIGATRRLDMDGDIVIHERLLGLSEIDHRVEFTIFESGLPISDYVAAIELRPISDGDRTYIRWSATFDAPPEHAAEMTARMPRDIYQPAFDALNARVAKG